ncbi:tyrosine-type recombinase/integrase [Variovorax paradoxus]|uniref:tyrosine-type recombinase/integrase n=1 Tax=Variovorax paradoxus TaxID=34073 RepID=UPI00277E5A2E|nr:site-specific integrase [Variovorax paradoxus]MDQ0590986.1 integrase [Variovorax paradoxus]
MAVKAKELSALEVGRLRSRPGLHAVGGVPGLYLQVTPTGATTWVLRTMIGSKRRAMGLGGFPGVTLAGARERAREARLQVEQGVDPILARQKAKNALRDEQAKALTFDEAVRRYIDAKSDEWRNVKHRAQWKATLETYASPFIGKMLVADVEQRHVLSVLEPIWKIKTETATRVRGRIETVLDWARVRGYREGDNPARWKGHLDALLPKPGKISKVVHHAALNVDAAAGFISALRQVNGMGARALEFAILTAARSGEVRGALWAEIDLDEGVWTVPAERMKAHKEHRVPLSQHAVKLLKNLPKVEGTDLVFPAPRGGQLSDMTLTAVMRRMGIDAVPHGFRSTFRDWVAERTNYPRELAEKALAHVLESKVEAAYQRSDMFDRRAHMMAAWAKFCETPVVKSDKSKKVVDLPTTKKAA